VSRQGGVAISESGLVFACVGCCCGHVERGGPKTAPRTLKREMRRAFRESGVDGRLRLAFTDCLGPCSEANVVFFYSMGRPLWLRRVNDVEAFAALLTWAREVLDGGAAALPPALAARSFTWTGGGNGPVPPISD
jgi:cobaltochelatase CobN